MHFVGGSLKHTIRQPPFLSSQKGGRYGIFYNELFYLMVLLHLFLSLKPHFIGFRDVLFRQIGILKLVLLVPFIFRFLRITWVFICFSVIAKVTKISSNRFVAREFSNINHFSDFFVIILGYPIFLVVFLISLFFQFLEYFLLLFAQCVVINCPFYGIIIGVLNSDEEVLWLINSLRDRESTYLIYRFGALMGPLRQLLFLLLLLIVRRDLVHCPRILFDQLLMLLFLRFAE